MTVWKRIFVGAMTLASIFGLVGVGKFAFAENGTGEGLVFGPTSQRISLEPGERYRGSIYISNPGDSTEDAKYSLSVTPYGVSNDNYDPVFDKVNTYTQITDWIALDETEGTLRPNEKRDIGFTINVPVDAPAGGQYATIMAQDMTHLEEQTSGGVLSISNITAIGSIVVADVAGTTREEGVISENNIPSFLFSSPLTATSTVENTGNVHTDASYVLQVWPLFSGEEVCTNEEDPDGEFVFPETKKYHTESCDLPAVGIFRAKQTVKIFGETSITEKMIIVCPIWLIFIILFVIFALIFYFVAKAKARKKAAKRAEKTA